MVLLIWWLHPPPYDKIRKYKGFTFKFHKIARELYRVIKKGGVVVWVVSDQTINGSETGTSFKMALYFMKIGFKLYDTMIYNKLGTVVQNPVVRYSQDFEYIFVFTKGFPETKNIMRGVATGKMIKKTKRHRQNEHLFISGIYQEGTAPFSNVFTYATGNNNHTKDKIAFKHPAIFPEALATDNIYSWSNENDIVYDPFAGSGTTIKMAHLQKRRYIGSEISKEYCDILNKRIEPYINQTTLL